MRALSLANLSSPRRAAAAKTPRGVAHSGPAGGAMHDDGSFVCAHGALSPPEVELARANFAGFDVDGDGLISHQDFVTAMSRHDPSWAAPNRRAQLDAMYAHVDVGGTGRVTFENFAVMRVQNQQEITA